MNKYDYVISLGFNCDIANGLIEGEIRDKSYPFDWNYTKMNKINNTIKEKFTNFFNIQNLASSNYAGRPAMDKDQGIIYVHNGSYRDLIKNTEYYNIRKENYNRRIDRLLKLLENENKILFVRLVQEDTYDEHLEFTNIVKELFPKCIFKLVLLIRDDRLDLLKYTEMTFENLVYFSGFSTMKSNKYCLSGLLRSRFDLPKHKQLEQEKHYY